VYAVCTVLSPTMEVGQVSTLSMYYCCLCGHMPSRNTIYVASFGLWQEQNICHVCTVYQYTISPVADPGFVDEGGAEIFFISLGTLTKNTLSRHILHGHRPLAIAFNPQNKISRGSYDRMELFFT
jgi:hypothetical protein